MGTPPTPTSAPHELEPDAPTPAVGRLAKASAWNLSLNLFNKSQTVALLAAGSIIGGLAGIGVIFTAMAAALLGHAIADFGLSPELTRLSVAYPNRPTVDRCVRAMARQAPFALLLAPTIYVVLGPAETSVSLLVVIGLNSSLLVATVGLTAVLNGLGDFRSPAARLGGARFLSSIAAVAAAIIEPTPTAVIGSFAAAEAIGLVALMRSIVHAKAALPAADHPQAHLQRERAWFGVASVVNLMTNQGDTILVASILSPEELGLFATASALENGVATLSLAPALPVAFRSVSSSLADDLVRARPLLRRAFATAIVMAVILSALTWIGAQLTGDTIDKLAGLAAGDGPLVLALCLASGPLGVAGDICIVLGVGFGRHRRVGMRQIQGGIVAVGAIVAGAHLAGVVGAAAGTIIRDASRLALVRRLAAPPRPNG